MGKMSEFFKRHIASRGFSNIRQDESTEPSTILEVLAEFKGTRAADVIQGLCHRLAVEEERAEYALDYVERKLADDKKIEIDISELGDARFEVIHALGSTSGGFYECLRYLIEYMIDMSRHADRKDFEIYSELPEEAER